MNHFCKEASQLQSDGFERKLTFGERIQLRIHLFICGACRNYSDNIKLLHTVLRDLRKEERVDETISLPEKDRTRISEALKNEFNS
jgi:predicted anti-sigma-YlaC factor YlaD